MDAVRLTRRQALAAAGATAAYAVTRPLWAATTAPITIVINQSPWFDSFRKTVELYEKNTGNKVDLDVNPFAGSLEKQRNSVRSGAGQYDILIMNSGWFAEMYAGGFVEAISDIEPGFKLDQDVYTLGDTVFYDPASKAMKPGGKLMSIPIQPNVPLLYYRGDLYKEAGLKEPETFAELEANAKKLHKPPSRYGIVQRGARGTHTVSYDFYPYLYGFGGGIFKDQNAGDYAVTLANDKGVAALEYYIRLAREAGHPQTASQDQAEVIQALLTGKAGHAMVVVAAVSQMDDKTKSAVVDKIEFAPPPHQPGFATAPALGHWLGGISKNVPDARKRGAVEFLRWFQSKEAQLHYAKSGGIPVSAAPYRDPMADERPNRWMKPLAKALPHAVNIYIFPEASEIISVLDLGLNRAIAGEVDAATAMNKMADEVQAIMARHGYRTGKA
jgi:multiple sugar transport system substrate-binding protein